MHQTPVADRQHRHPQFMDSLTAHLLVRVSNQREADGGRLSQTLSVYLREQCAVWDRNTIWIAASIATDCARPIVRNACSKADLRAPLRRCSASFQTRHCHSFSRSHWQPLVDTVVTRAPIHPRVRIMRGGAYGYIRAHIYQICHGSGADGSYPAASCTPAPPSTRRRTNRMSAAALTLQVEGVWRMSTRQAAVVQPESTSS
jgi:hypothetical protein